MGNQTGRRGIGLLTLFAGIGVGSLLTLVIVGVVLIMLNRAGPGLIPVVQEPTTDLNTIRLTQSAIETVQADAQATASTRGDNPDEPPAAPTGNGPQLAGCPVFPADHILNTRIDDLPVHPLSDAYVNSIGLDTTLHPDFGSGLWDGALIGIPFNIVAGSSVPDAEISFYYPKESDPGPYPIPDNPLIEGGGDRHILLVDTDTCWLHEIFDADPQRTRWEAGSGASWDLTGYDFRPDGWTSADAAGLPILPLLIRYDEAASGEIKHAIRFTAEETQQAYVWPARHFASHLTDPNIPPLGMYFRLRADFDVSPYPPEIQAILVAMQRYGLILADNGSNWYISGVPDERWDNDALHEAFDTISGADFEAVDVSSLMTNPDSGKAAR